MINLLPARLADVCGKARQILAIGVDGVGRGIAGPQHAQKLDDGFSHGSSRLGLSCFSRHDPCSAGILPAVGEGILPFAAAAGTAALLRNSTSYPRFRTSAALHWAKC